MTYKEQKWFELKRNGIKFELIVRDQDFKKLETRKFASHDFKKTIKDIGNRYGISEKLQTPNQEVQDELEWLKRQNII